MREFTARGIRLSEPELFVPFSYPVWPHPENRKPRMCHCAQSGFNANDPGSIGNHHSSSRTTKVARHSSRPSCGAAQSGLGGHQEEARTGHHNHEMKADIRG